MNNGENMLRKTDEVSEIKSDSDQTPKSPDSATLLSPVSSGFSTSTSDPSTPGRTLMSPVSSDSDDFIIIENYFGTVTTPKNTLEYDELIRTTSNDRNSQDNPTLINAELGQQLLRYLARGTQADELRHLIREGIIECSADERKLLLSICEMIFEHSAESHVAIKNFLDHYILDLDINAVDPITGRAALHEAASHLQGKIYKYLIASGADETLRDKEGFTPRELHINPHPYSPVRDETTVATKIQKYRKRIAAINASDDMPENRALVYIDNISEINTIIDRHPELECIGFIVRKPNCIKIISDKTNDFHVSPIFFERMADTKSEHFVQFDAALAQAYLLPKSSNPTIKRRLTYSDRLRNQDPQGDFADAVDVLMKLLNWENFHEFYLVNAKKDETIAQGLRAVEYQKLTYLPYYLTDYLREEDELHNLNRRQEYQDQAWMYPEDDFVKEIYILTKLPRVLLPTIKNRYQFFNRLGEVYQGALKPPSTEDDLHRTLRTYENF